MSVVKRSSKGVFCLGNDLGWGVLEQSQFSGSGHGLGAVGHAQFTDDVAGVFLGRGHRNEEFSSNFLVGQADSHQAVPQ